MPDRADCVGVLAAQANGINIVCDPRESSHAWDFADYGIDNRGDRATLPPSDDDPFVQVSPVLERVSPGVCDSLLDPQFVSHVNNTIGPHWPPGDDFGTERYCRMLSLVYAYISNCHPDEPRIFDLPPWTDLAV